MNIQPKRLFFTVAVWTMSAAASMAQLGLKVNVHIDVPGTLFVKIMEQIEELGELSDITELTVSGQLNGDDRNVLANQTPNLFHTDFSGVAAECAKYISMRHHHRLKSIILPTDSEELPEDMINGCDSLLTIILPNGLKAIPNNFAEGCKQLTSIDIPATVKAIGYSGFAWCSALSKVNLRSDTLIIRDFAFRGTALETFTLREGQCIQGDGAFAECPYLRSFTFPDGLTDQEGVGTGTFWNDTALTIVRLPHDLTVVPHDFFASSGISSIDLPSTVTAIEEEAFAGCTKLKTIVIPKTVTRIGPRVFSYSSLERFDWPDQLTTIPSQTFEGCSNLTECNIPATVNNLEPNVFYACSSLKSISLPEGIATIPENFFNECGKLAQVKLPSTVTRVKYNAFQNCTSLRHIDLPDAITYIEDGAFSHTGLEELRLPSQLRTIGRWAFIDGKYHRVVVPEGVTWIGNGVFSSESLTCIDFPSTLVFIGDNPFNDGNPADSLVMRAAIPPYHGDFFSYWGREHETTFYVPAKSLSLYQGDPAFGRALRFETLDVEPTLLRIVDETIIDKNSALQEGKYDVEFYNLAEHNELYEDINRYPRLRIDEGATLHAGRFQMSYIMDNWRSYYDVFINKGTFTADQIDLRCFFQGRTIFTPSFDVHMADIYSERQAPFVFFRYDGAARAATQFDKTWVRVKADETLHAGQTYCVRTERLFDKDLPRDSYDHSQRVWDYVHLIPAAGGADYLSSSADARVPLQHYPSEFPHNQSWNAVGMPYTSYLDIRGLDYDGPILVWNFNAVDYDEEWNENRTGSWVAYSALDDEVVIKPMQAIFLQAPDGVDALTFSADRRQMTSTFVKGDTENNSRALRLADKRRNRAVFNATVTRFTEQGEEVLDRTRFVINPEATLRYDIGRDAPKMSDAEGPADLLYTISEGLAYAINERPIADGIVRLAFQAATPGQYKLTFASSGTETSTGSDSPVLIDQETGVRTPLNEPYTFTLSTPGNVASRFVIAFAGADTQAITDVEEALPIRSEGIFNLAGQRVGSTTEAQSSALRKGIYIEQGRKVIKK